MERIRQYRPDDLKKALFELFEGVAERLEEERPHAKKTQMSPTARQTFIFWLRCTIDHVNDQHLHISPSDIAATRSVSLTRAKQNLSQIYLAFNVCCEAELFMIVRLTYIMLAMDIPRSQIEQVLWKHICGLS